MVNVQQKYEPKSRGQGSGPRIQKVNHSSEILIKVAMTLILVIVTFLRMFIKNEPNCSFTLFVTVCPIAEETNVQLINE